MVRRCDISHPATCKERIGRPLGNNILEAEKGFQVKYFYVVVDMGITSLNERFKELVVFKDLFDFLLSSHTRKSLSDSQLEEDCRKFLS
jgi:hypothetical protein